MRPDPSVVARRVRPAGCPGASTRSVSRLLHPSLEDDRQSPENGHRGASLQVARQADGDPDGKMPVIDQDRPRAVEAAGGRDSGRSRAHLFWACASNTKPIPRRDSIHGSRERRRTLPNHQGWQFEQSQADSRFGLTH